MDLLIDIDKAKVPKYTAYSFRKRNTKYCLIIPVFNEGQRFFSQVEKMRLYGIFDLIDVIVADAASQDGSTDSNFLGMSGFRALLIRKGKGRYSTDMRMGWHWAIKEGYMGFIMVDGNDKDDISPLAINSFIDKLDQGFDYIQGSRFIEGGKAIRTPLSRLFAIKFICGPIMKIAGGRKVTDGTNGFRAYSKRFLLDDRVSVFRDEFQKYEVTYYLPPRAGRLGFNCTEVPVTRVYPDKGEIPTKVNIQANIEVVILLIKILFGKLNPPRTENNEIST